MTEIKNPLVIGDNVLYSARALFDEYVKLKPDCTEDDARRIATIIRKCVVENLG